MKARTFLAAAFFFACFALNSSAEIDVSHSDEPRLIKHALTLGVDDAVIIRTKSGPIAFVRFLSLKTNEVSFLWCYIGSSPQTKCSDDIQKVQLRSLPGQERVTFPTKTTKTIERGIAAEAQIKAGDILATLSVNSAGRFSLEYYRESAQVDFLPGKENLPADHQP